MHMAGKPGYLSNEEGINATKKLLLKMKGA